MNSSINKMEKMPVNKLLVSMGTPMIISMVLQALYNIVDSAFVADMKNGGEAALNALTLAFPIQILMVAVGIGTGVGSGALLSKSLGMSDKKRAAFTAGNSVFLGIVISVICILFGIFGVDAYIGTQTSNPEIFGMAVGYLRICCVISFGMILFSVFEKLLQATGLSVYSTIAQISGAVINIILDPILIYGLIGAPEMGVIGAAAATVIGQIASFLIALFFHITKNKSVPMGIKYIVPSMKIIKDIYKIGVPAIIAQALMSVMTYGINIILVRVDEALVTAYGLYYKIQQFILFAAFGLRDAITPIVSFSYGMEDKKRINNGIKYGVLYTLVIMIIGMAALELFAKPLSSVFGLSGKTQKLCISAIRIISVSFVFAGINIALQGVFQALDGGIQSLTVSVLRQFLLVLPVAWLFSLAAMSNPSMSFLIWLTFPIAEILSAVCSGVFLKKIRVRLELQSEK